MVYVHIGSVLILPESMTHSYIVAWCACDNIGIVTWTQGVSAHYQCEHTPCIVIPILSPFLFIQSLYASFLKFIGFLIYLSVICCIPASPNIPKSALLRYTVILDTPRRSAIWLQLNQSEAKYSNCSCEMSKADLPRCPGRRTTGER